MNARTKTRLVVAGGAATALIALVVVVVALAGLGSSPRSFVKDHYTAAGKRDGGEVYTTSRSVSDVTDDLTGEWKPANRLVDPGGVFLRYADDIVSIRPRAAGGSEVRVDDADRGYASTYPVTAGWFGTYSGRGEAFRGGGPGTGK